MDETATTPFYVIGREESEEGQGIRETHFRPAWLLWDTGTKSQQELNLERKDYRQILLYKRLEKAIRKLNPE